MAQSDTLSIGGYARIVRRRFRTVLLLLVLIVGGAAVGTAATVPTYVARADVALSVPVEFDSRFQRNGTEYATSLVRACTAMATRGSVLEPALADAGVAGLGVDEFAASVSAHARRGLMLVEVQVDDASPRRAADLATAVAARLDVVCDDLRQTDAGGQNFTFTTLGAADAAHSPSSPRWTLNLGVATVLGLLVGIAAAIGVDVVAARAGGEYHEHEADDRGHQ